MRRRPPILLVAAMTGVALLSPATSSAVAQDAASDAIATVGSERPAPLVDHHQHLTSPALAALVSREPAPRVDVPADVARLLAERGDAAQDAERLERLYSDDAVFLAGGLKAGWIRGAGAIASELTSLWAPGYRLTPTAYSRGGDVAQISGYYVRGEESAPRRPGYFSMTAVHADGQWRITSETPVFPGPRSAPLLDAAGLIELLNAARIARAVVLSEAFFFDGLFPNDGNRHDQVRQENDWTSVQASRFPDRLVGFCSFNPLADYALAEMERCAALPNMKGVKLHFQTSGVDIRNPEHLSRVVGVFRGANRLGLPLLVHASSGGSYDSEHARILVDHVLPTAPDVPVVMAHLWGGDSYKPEVLALYAEAVSSSRPGTARLYFDLSQASTMAAGSDDALREVATRIRQIGLDRMLYGSDGVFPNGMPPRHM